MTTQNDFAFFGLEDLGVNESVYTHKYVNFDGLVLTLLDTSSGMSYVVPCLSRSTKKVYDLIIANDWKVFHCSKFNVINDKYQWVYRHFKVNESFLYIEHIVNDFNTMASRKRRNNEPDERFVGEIWKNGIYPFVPNLTPLRHRVEILIDLELPLDAHYQTILSAIDEKRKV